MKKVALLCSVAGCTLSLVSAASAATVVNPICTDNTALYNPGDGEDIVVPKGYNVSLFKGGLNFPTGIAFLRTDKNGGKPGKDGFDKDFNPDGSGDFEIYVLESGHGLPSICNEQDSFGSGQFDPTNPFTPDVLVFDQHGKQVGAPLGKPSATGGGLQAAGPAVDLAFEKGLDGGRLFVSDSNQATHAAGQNNSSRIVTMDPQSGSVTPFITNLPTGDHPTEQFAFKDGWIYWSQGSTTNSGVVGRDNGGGTNQQDIPCQDIVLSNNVFDSGGGVKTSGYSPFNTQNPGGTVKAFTSASHHGVCDGAILRARLDSEFPDTTIEPYSWGYRNGYALRFAPRHHVLEGNLLVGEDGADERGARPSNHAPENLQLAVKNPDGSPDYHGWPDQYGFLPANSSIYNPVGGPGDDLCVADATNTPSMCSPASLAQILSEDVPVKPVLASPPQEITSPLAIEAPDSSFTGIEFVPQAFVHGPVQPGAALYSLEGDFGFSASNAPPGGHETGHEVKVINFSGSGKGLKIALSEFAHNNTFDQAFVSGIRGMNRPTNVRMGPDGCAWVVDYGAVRDFGQGGLDSKFIGAANGPLVQIPGTGAVWRICRNSGD
jgi:hypothetical protein